ncbi:hypothetical protein NM208_g11170 [Fusarium decemcellulare]|uniref:Uncharacterized protein n=1 Tax=Fusarium decemcellulare TaxID=57161 RepID=A0ACC1RVA2_9HYPO|nr:hypothetical protein NM208_g11170 [Fusarium decemcellulare]
MDPRLAGIYNGERRMGDRNTVLRGTKHTDFSHVRKLAAPFIQKKSQSSTSSIPSNPSLALNQKVPTRRPDPIILLSPSASSLLRLSNARSFLEDGKYVPADAGGSTATMLHVQRIIRSVDPNRPMRFILVEGSEQFKPEYWNRIVAVFTTGQTWQFKNYKWSDPNELFKHTLGIFVGWRGDQAPDNIRGWGHRVLSTGVDRWRGDGHDASRFRDKEVVEHIWRAIEDNMRARGGVAEEHLVLESPAPLTKQCALVPSPSASDGSPEWHSKDTTSPCNGRTPAPTPRSNDKSFTIHHRLRDTQTQAVSPQGWIYSEECTAAHRTTILPTLPLLLESRTQSNHWLSLVVLHTQAFHQVDPIDSYRTSSLVLSWGSPYILVTVSAEPVRDAQRPRMNKAQAGPGRAEPEPRDDEDRGRSTWQQI